MLPFLNLCRANSDFTKAAWPSTARSRAASARATFLCRFTTPFRILAQHNRLADIRLACHPQPVATAATWNGTGEPASADRASEKCTTRNLGGHRGVPCHPVQGGRTGPRPKRDYQPVRTPARAPARNKNYPGKQVTTASEPGDWYPEPGTRNPVPGSRYAVTISPQQESVILTGSICYPSRVIRLTGRG